MVCFGWHRTALPALIMKRPSATQVLLLHMRIEGLPDPELEFRFHPTRKWRFDLAFPVSRDREQPVAVEIHGGVYRFGRHVRGDGFSKDREKMNAAVELGWRVLEYTTAQVESGEAIRQLKRVLL
jgi:hypothetical protein